MKENTPWLIPEVGEEICEERKAAMREAAQRVREEIALARIIRRIENGTLSSHDVAVFKELLKRKGSASEVAPEG